MNGNLFLSKLFKYKWIKVDVMEIVTSMKYKNTIYTRHYWLYTTNYAGIVPRSI